PPSLASIHSSQLQQHEPFLVVERAFLDRRRCARGLRQRLRQLPLRGAVTATLLRGREFAVTAQIELAGGDRLIDVAADGVDLAAAVIDVSDHLAMAAPDRAGVRASAEFAANALAHRRIAGIDECGLALGANHVADAGPRGERTGAVNMLVGFPGDL